MKFIHEAGFARLAVSSMVSLSKPMQQIIRRDSPGFALPSILIASIIMLTVLVSAVSAASSISKSVEDQYYLKHAKEAAESGAARANACLNKDLSVAVWSQNNLPLKPNTNCDGSVVTGASAYVHTGSNFRTKFTVGTVTASASHIKVTSIGETELFRTSSPSSVQETYTYNLVTNVPLSEVTSTYSSSGIFEVCGIINGEAWCWGDNNYGQLGDGTLTDSNVPVRTLRESGALLGKTDKYVAVGNLTACIVTTTNEIYCMGHNSAGQVGDGTTTNRSVPTPVDTSTGLAGKTITGIVANEGVMCAIASGDVYCWGSAGWGKLGNGQATTNALKPVRVSMIGATDGKTVTEIASTPQSRSSCAIAAGQAYCWGYNDRGQLGDQTTTQRNSPVPVYTGGALGTRTVVDLAVAGGAEFDAAAAAGTPDKTRRGHACAVTSDGKLFCWGSNQYGQMGQGTSSVTAQMEPIMVNGLLSTKTVVSTATAYATPCALTADNLMYCWGSNHHGVVGDNTTTHRYAPVAVVVQNPGLLDKTITFITGGVNRNCAIASGTTYCWGLNSQGQLGDGTYTSRYVPTEAIFLKKRTNSLYY
ncbi:MAG: chromosome condensation regulator [Candidatus Saccharibacteria bacterium]|jgi:alpha-tubulin suppressor-like RCC1 family protein|nr:chromosome condensation regulator [Candidatus Saccharibacteria bacterium]